MPGWYDSKCGKTVPGGRVERCPACHQSFGGTTLGDAHRTGPWEARVCVDPATLRRVVKGVDIGPLLERDERGVWRSWLTEEERAKQAAYWAEQNARKAHEREEEAA